MQFGKLRFDGRSKPKQAMAKGTCAGCGGRINIGDMICFDSQPEPRSRYHATCPTVQTEKRPIPPERDTESDESSETTWETAKVEVEPEEKTAAQSSIDDIIDSRIKIALGGFKPSEVLTAEKALEIAKTAIDENLIKTLVEKFTAPKEVTHKIIFPDGKAKTVEGKHFLFPRIVNLVKAGFNVVLWGPAGTGKTQLAIHVAEFCGLDYELETMDRTVSRSAILGYKDINGKPVYTPFLTAYQKGRASIIDELDAADGGVHVLYNTALANGHAPAAWEGGVKRHEKWMFIATMNTPGCPTPDFPDRKWMGAALRDRLYFVHVPKDENIVNRIVGLPLVAEPERRLTTASPAEWVTWCRKVAAWSKTPAPTWRVGQRAELEGAKALSIGETVTEVAHALVFRGADEQLIAKCLTACPLPERPMPKPEAKK